MGFVQRLFGRSRLRQAKRNLTADPSPRNYAVAIQEYARAGALGEALALSEEGLEHFPGNPLLATLHERSLLAVREDRIRALRQELELAPRAALWREMCEVLSQLGQLRRAEDYALQWVSRADDGEARLMLARLRVERFYEDRGRALGTAALEAIEAAREALPGDLRPLRLGCSFLARIGAFGEARDMARAMLEITPGDLELEGRFRSYQDRAEDAPDVARALVSVERTGRFLDEDASEDAGDGGFGGVRPVLRELTQADDVRAALYLRGSTVLVQGPQGATAERMARGVRSVLSTGRTASRRLGLGAVQEISLEGGFGVLTVAPGALDAGAVWSDVQLDGNRRTALLCLAGRGASKERDEEVDA